ncbi:hypothetical protein DL764_010603 [Monosporascus ibericus]|uniref:Apple domain-containing protein n=1 Tax=Monosporascus ibericus TaxID=155417 RepID=A0A4Q4STZ1_9PEZI|nr:hypothetical protein DL764_010603 [Monosporascus ibericus]
MSYQLRPLQPQPPQQQQQEESEYGTYEGSNGSARSQSYTLYPPQYQWPRGYGNGVGGVDRAQSWLQNNPATKIAPHLSSAKSPFINGYGTGNPGADMFNSGHPYSLPPRTVSSQHRRTRIWGVKRGAFFVVLAIGCCLMVLGIAIGVGVGETSDSSSSSTTTTATSTSSAPTPSFTGTVVLAPVICPENNNTVYVTAADAPKPFNVECGRDYGSEDGARDMATRRDVATMAECVDLCGSRAGCVGVGYGDVDGAWTCWLKSQLGQPNWSDGWYAARLQNVDW